MLVLEIVFVELSMDFVKDEILWVPSKYIGSGYSWYVGRSY